MDDFDNQYRMLMDRLDGITSEIYTVGAMEERATMTEFLQGLILEKDQQHDTIAVEVLGWALERLSVAN